MAVPVTGATQRGSLPFYLGSILVVVVVAPAARCWSAGRGPPLRLLDTPLQAAGRRA